MRGNFLILWKLETIYGKSDNKLKSVTAVILYKKVRLHMQL